MPTIEIVTAGRPKRDIVEMAFEFCGSAGYEFERTPEEIASALRELDTMMAEWPWSELDYNFSEYGAGLPTDLSGLPNDAIGAASKMLGLRIAPSMGKSLSPAVAAPLTMAYNLVCSKYGGSPPQARIPALTVRGSGGTYRLPFIAETGD